MNDVYVFANRTFHKSALCILKCYINISNKYQFPNYLFVLVQIIVINAFEINNPHYILPIRNLSVQISQIKSPWSSACLISSRVTSPLVSEPMYKLYLRADQVFVYVIKGTVMVQVLISQQTTHFPTSQCSKSIIYYLWIFQVQPITDKSKITFTNSSFTPLYGQFLSPLWAVLYSII